MRDNIFDKIRKNQYLVSLNYIHLSISNKRCIPKRIDSNFVIYVLNLASKYGIQGGVEFCLNLMNPMFVTYETSLLMDLSGSGHRSFLLEMLKNKDIEIQCWLGAYSDDGDGLPIYVLGRGGVVERIYLGDGGGG